jgi:hypothetical protein
MAGVSISAGLTRLLPRWTAVLGVVLAVCGELSWLNLIFPSALSLIPLTRFPGVCVDDCAGIALPNPMPQAIPGISEPFTRGELSERGRSVHE